VGDDAVSKVSAGSAMVVVGTVLQTPGPDRLEVLDRVAVEIDADGTVVGVHPAGSEAATTARRNAIEVVVLRDDQRLLPGLVDLHVHAPQWPQLGTGLDLPLERWLFEYTFPLEARYANLTFAAAVWSDLVRTLLAHGTTTAVYYATVHEEATALLASTCVELGQRAFVGRVAMDHPEGTPPWYRDDDAAAGIAASRRSVEFIRSLAGADGLVQPIITPRFVPACTDALLAGLGELAGELGVRVQTHCSESDWEHSYVLDRYGESDTSVLHRLGLAKAHSVLAHCDHMGIEDLERAAASGAGVAHCPLSNAYFAGAVFPVRRALEHGVRVGLGTDIAGGAHPGLLHQSAMAVTASRYLDDGVNPELGRAERGVIGSRIDTVTAFWMATLGGAEVLDLPVGLIAPGRSFDAIVVDIARPGSPLRSWDDLDTPERLFEKIVRLAGPDDISRVWVAGRTRGLDFI
jgi:guanine deaminase